MNLGIFGPYLGWMPLLSFLLLRSDDEVDQVLRRFPQGFLATKGTVNSEGGLRERRCYPMESKFGAWSVIHPGPISWSRRDSLG